MKSSNTDLEEMKEQLRSQIMEELREERIKKLEALHKSTNKKYYSPYGEFKEFVDAGLGYMGTYEKYKVIKGIYILIRYLTHTSNILNLKESEKAINIGKDIIEVIKKYDPAINDITNLDI